VKSVDSAGLLSPELAPHKKLSSTFSPHQTSETKESIKQLKAFNVARIEFEEKLINDIGFIYQKSYSELETVFKKEFRQSKTFKDMVLLMNQNMVEFKFMRQAGLA
jgi:hypothetical protein